MSKVKRTAHGKIVPRDDIDARRLQTAQDPKTWILHPGQIGEGGEMRIKQWAAEIMRKNEHRFTPKWQDRQIVYKGDVDPEAIDVRGIYPYPNLHWVIWKNKELWSFMLLSEHRMLFNIDFAKI